MKNVIIIFAVMMKLVPTVYDEEKSWYEIDGIKFRYGHLQNLTLIYLPWEGKPSFLQLGTKSNIIQRRDDFSHLKDITLFPIAITLPEKLMNSWSFRGGFIEWHYSNEQDLPPYPDDDKQIIQSDTTNWRQNSSLRTSLYNNFFNASDKTFADANSNWALSADVTSSRVFLGYYWGVFIPAFEYHRFAKMGLGLGAFYGDLSYKLNLCSQYKVTPSLEDDGKVALNGHGGECVGKTEIDSASYKWGGVAFVAHVAIWEGVSKDTILKFFVMDYANDLGSLQTSGSLKLKNHSKNLEVEIQINSFELLSYTYRF